MILSVKNNRQKGKKAANENGLVRFGEDLRHIGVGKPGTNKAVPEGRHDYLPNVFDRTGRLNCLV